MEKIFSLKFTFFILHFALCIFQRKFTFLFKTLNCYEKPLSRFENLPSPLFFKEG